MKEARAAQREGVAIPAPISSTSSMQRTTQPRPGIVLSTSLDVLPSQGLRDTGGNNPLEVPKPGERREKNESPLHQVDPSRERNATGLRAQQVDRTASVQPSSKPFIYSPPLNRPTASMSPLPSLPVPTLTRTASNRVHTARDIRSDEFQARTWGAPLELTQNRGKDRREAPPEEKGRISPSGTPSGLPSALGDHAAATTEHPSQPQPISASHRLDKSNSGLRGSEGARRDAKQAEGLNSDKNERKRATAPEEYETCPEDSATSSDDTARRKAEPNPTTNDNSNVIQHTKLAESFVGQTHSSNPSRGNDSNAPRLLEMGGSRGKVGQSSDSAPHWGRKETPITPPPLALVSTQNQPKHVIRVPSNGNLTVSSVNPQPHQLRPPSVVGDSHIPNITPFRKSLPFLTARRSTPLI